MVKIGICQVCGKKMSEVWKENTRCIECGGRIEKIEVDMGFWERAPRILMVGGVGFSLFAVLYLLYKMITGDLGQDEGITSMVMFLVGIGFFAASLVIRMQASAKAIEEAPSVVSERKQRRIKRPPTRERPPVRSGKIENRPRRTTSKIPVTRK